MKRPKVPILLPTVCPILLSNSLAPYAFDSSLIGIEISGLAAPTWVRVQIEFPSPTR